MKLKKISNLQHEKRKRLTCVLCLWGLHRRNCRGFVALYVVRVSESKPVLSTQSQVGPYSGMHSTHDFFFFSLVFFMFSSLPQDRHSSQEEGSDAMETRRQSTASVKTVESGGGTASVPTVVKAPPPTAMAGTLTVAESDGTERGDDVVAMPLVSGSKANVSGILVGGRGSGKMWSSRDAHVIHKASLHMQTARLIDFGTGGVFLKEALAR